MTGGGLFLDKEVDEELSRLAGDHLADAGVHDRIRRKLAQISEKDAVNILISHSRKLAGKYQNGLPGTRIRCEFHIGGSRIVR